MISSKFLCENFSIILSMCLWHVSICSSSTIRERLIPNTTVRHIYTLCNWPMFLVNNSLTKPRRKFLQRKKLLEIIPGIHQLIILDRFSSTFCTPRGNIFVNERHRDRFSHDSPILSTSIRRELESLERIFSRATKG